MCLQIICCINNLRQHGYGDKLNELAGEGVDISLERCLSQCIGCRLQPAFMADGKWYGLTPDDDLKKMVYTKVNQIG
jgi:hypothetical protein